MAKTVDERSAWERFGYSVVPNAFVRIPTISDGAKVTYLALMEFWQGKEECWPSVAALCERRGKSRSQVHSHLRELEAAGLIEREYARTNHVSRTIRKDLRTAIEGTEWFETIVTAEGDRTENRSGMSGKPEVACPENRSRKKAKGRSKLSPSGKPSGDHAEFVRWLCEEAYPKRHGGEAYPFDGGKDGRAVKELLAAYGLEDLKRITVAAFKDDWISGTGFSVGKLRSSAAGLFSQLARRRATKGSAKRRKVIEDCKDCLGAGCRKCRAAAKKKGRKS